MHTHPRTTALDVVLAVMPAIRRVHDTIRAHDRQLADQLKRAAHSIALNLAEASGNRAGTRRERLHSAFGSLTETRAALKVAVAWGYIGDRAVREIDAELDQVAAMTWRRVHGRRPVAGSRAGSSTRDRHA